jgi:arginine deiminase
MRFGVGTEFGRLAEVALRSPREAFASQARCDAQWRDLGYLAAPDFDLACRQHDELARLLDSAGVKVHLAPGGSDLCLDAVYTRDPVLVTPVGAVICRMGKPARDAEPVVAQTWLSTLGIPVAGRIDPPGRLEGGDACWLAPGVLAVGRGYRTNDEGIAQLRAILAPAVDELVIAHLPHHHGPGEVLHLMTPFSPVDADLAVAHLPLLPVSFLELLTARRVRLVETPPDEFVTQGCNVLALGPRDVLIPSGNDVTKRGLIAAGCKVTEFDGSEIAVKGGGGPTCLTMPIRREPPP